MYYEFEGIGGTYEYHQGIEQGRLNYAIKKITHLKKIEGKYVPPKDYFGPYRQYIPNLD